MKIRYFLFAISMLITVACTTSSSQHIVGQYDSTEQAFHGVVVQDGNEGKTCPPLPTTFVESDLTGIWKSYYNAIGTTILILKEDGTYKQIHDYVSSRSNYHYESDWLPWELERHDTGPSYIHFEGMLGCGTTCVHNPGGKWYDFCSQQMITMKENEVVLVVANTASLKMAPEIAPPRGIQMYELGLDPDTLPVVYQLQH